jgi:hypothetical protein
MRGFRLENRGWRREDVYCQAEGTSSAEEFSGGVVGVVEEVQDGV